MSTFNPNAYGCPQRYTKKPLGGVGTSIAPVKPENKDLKPDIKNVKPEKKDLKSGDHVSKLFAQASARAVVTSVKPETKDLKSETKDPKSEKKDLKSGEQVSKLFALASARIGDGRDARNSVDGQLKTAKVEVARLRKQIAEKDSASDVLAQEMAAATEKLRCAEAKIAAQRNALKALDQKSKTHVQERDDAVREHDELKQQLNAAMKERDAATVESVERLQQYTAIVVERDSIAQKLDAMTQKHDALIAEPGTTAQDHVDLFDRMAAIFKECGDVARELQAITQEHNSITNERDAVVQERNAIITERDAVVQELDTFTIERDVAVQQCKTITQERDENAQKNAAIILERDDLAQKLKTMTKERDVSAQQCKSITQARDEYAQKNAAVIQERDSLAQKLDITTKERNTITIERDLAVQKCKTITQEREEHAQKNSAVIQERDNLAQKLEATTKERDTTTAERDTLMHDMTNKLKDMTKERDAISAERNTSVKKLEKKLKDAEDFISWQKSQITILELDEHQIASLKLQLKQSRTIQEDSWVEKVHLGREIAELEQQLSRVSQQASEMQAAGEYYMHAADQAASEAAYARQQRDNAYVACSAAQKMATASGQITHLEQQLDGLRATCASTSAKLVDAQVEATRLAAEKDMLAADLAAAKSSSGAAHSVEVAGAVTEVTCVVAKYAALPKAEQKAGNQPSVGECPCYFHVERALRFARTYDMCHRSELDKANFERLCVEDELHELKREFALRSVTQAACMEEKESEAGTVVEEKEEEEEEEWEEGSVAESEESVEFILERPSSSPASSFTRRS